MRGGAVPALHCREFYAPMEELFTPEEAELASKMPFVSQLSRLFGHQGDLSWRGIAVTLLRAHSCARFKVKHPVLSIFYGTSSRYAPFVTTLPLCISP